MVAHMPEFCLGVFPRSAKDAVWMESLVRTMSSGYVNVTEVMPAKPPHNRRVKGVKESPEYLSKMF